MKIVDVLASMTVFLAGTYLVGLAAVAIAAPSKAKAFLGRFASSAFAHYLELSLRLIVGAALVRVAPAMPVPGFFRVFGWIFVVTTIALFAVPWQWHHRFARWSVPLATRRLNLLALGAFLAGAGLILSVVS